MATNQVDKNTTLARIDPSTVVTILSGVQRTPEVKLAGTTLCGIIFPEVMTGTIVTIEMTPNGEDYFTVFDSSATQVQVKVVNGYAFIDPIKTVGFDRIKIVSNINEGDDRALTLLLRLIG